MKLGIPLQKESPYECRLNEKSICCVLCILPYQGLQETNTVRTAFGLLIASLCDLVKYLGDAIHSVSVLAVAVVCVTE